MEDLAPRKGWLLEVPLFLPVERERDLDLGLLFLWLKATGFDVRSCPPDEVELRTLDESLLKTPGMLGSILPGLDLICLSFVEDHPRKANKVLPCNSGDSLSFFTVSESNRSFDHGEETISLLPKAVWES